jgi:hypothetical protein
VRRWGSPDRVFVEYHGRIASKRTIANFRPVPCELLFKATRCPTCLIREAMVLLVITSGCSEGKVARYRTIVSSGGLEYEVSKLTLVMIR